MTDSIRGRTPASRSNASASLPTIQALESRQLLSVAPAAATGAAIRGKAVLVNAVEGQAFTNTPVWMTTASTSSTFTATIDWGDKTTPTTGTVSGDGAGNFTVAGDHDYVKFGNYRIKVTLTNSNTSKVTTVFSVAKVKDAALSAGGISFTSQKASLFTGSVATFTDDDPNAVVTPKPTETAMINWGDGTASAGTITQATPGGPFTVSGKHTYGVAKTFNVTTLIRDPGGSKATATSQATVLGPQKTTTPSLVGNYSGTVHVHVIISTSLNFNLDITSQDLNSITGTLNVEGVQAVSGTFDATGTVGELTNGNFKYVYQNGSITVTISGHVSSDGKHITSGFFMATGLPKIPVVESGSLHGTFTLDLQ
jgi:hypothetical protein